MPQNLEHNKTLEIAVLPDKSTLYIKRSFTTLTGEYSVIRKMKGDKNSNEMVLEDNIETIDAALNRAWFYFNMLNK